MKKSGFLLYAAAILAAILDYKNAKLVTSSHPVRISSIYQVLLKNAKKKIFTKHCKVPVLSHWTIMELVLYSYVIGALSMSK